MSPRSNVGITLTKGEMVNTVEPLKQMKHTRWIAKVEPLVYASEDCATREAISVCAVIPDKARMMTEITKMAIRIFELSPCTFYQLPIGAFANHKT